MNAKETRPMQLPEKIPKYVTLHRIVADVIWLNIFGVVENMGKLRF